MSTQVTFGDFVVINSTEGGWMEPELGFINNEWQFCQLANADGELAKPVSGKGTEHRITIQFRNVPVSGTATIRTRMRNLRRQGVQTLSIPEFPVIPNCVVDKIQQTQKRVAVTTSFSSGQLQQTAGHNLEYAITFHQLFE